MNRYSPRWLKIIFAAIIFHLLAGLILMVALPKILPEKISAPEELTWLDVNLAADSEFVDEEILPVEETAPEPEFQLFEMPELIIPQTIFEPLPELPKPPPKIEPPPEKVEPPPEKSTPKMTRPPITVTEYSPPKGSGRKAKVIVKVTIDREGSVTAAEIIHGTGENLIDELAQDYASKWTFRPALDQIGRPMQSDKIITIDFEKFE